jgi:PAS domain S-box-containing protein
MKLSGRSWIALIIAAVIMLCFLSVQTALVLKYIQPSHEAALFGYWSIIAFMPFFYFVVIEFVRKARHKFQSIDDTFNAIDASNIVLEFDKSGTIRKANSKFYTSFGYADIIGQRHKVLVGDVDANEYNSFWNQLRVGRFKQGEYERLKSDGSVIWLFANYNPIKDPYGEVYKVMLIATDITDKKIIEADVNKKNSYLEHAAKILRHDMHSGINTYIPRGLSSLKRRLSEEQIKDLKIDAPLRMIEEGLTHTQKVYKGVKEFTNLVKADAQLEKNEFDLREILISYLSSTSYEKQVVIEELPIIEVNESLFCTAVDNLIRNGLKYNDSSTKVIRIFAEDNYLCIVDNGRGMSQEDLIQWSQPYKRKEGQKEAGSGLGLNICIAIMDEHKFLVTAEKLEIGTKLKIKIR